jgi:hypothetical protein
MTDWHPRSDELVELALAEVDAPGQERILAHLTTCPACRDEYTEVSDGIQQALAATPSLAPPAGFSGRVLDAMAAESASLVRPVQRTRLLLVAAAVVVGLLAGVGGTLAATTWLNRPPGVASTAPVATRLLTATGEDVGSAGIASLSGRSYLVLNVTAGKPGVRYDCILVGRDGTRTDGGSWALADGYGTGVASGSWLVPLSGDTPASVELVGPAGAVWSRAIF